MAALPNESALFDTALNKESTRQGFIQLRNFLVGLLGTDGVAGTARKALDTLCADYALKSAPYAVLAADDGTLIGVSGTTTITLPALSSVSIGFAVVAKNVGTGTVTLARSGSDAINGAASNLTLGAQEWAIVEASSGTNWEALRGGPIAQFISAAGTGIAVASGTASITPIGWELVSQTTVGTAVASVDFTGLTGNEYRVEWSGALPSVSGYLFQVVPQYSGTTWEASSTIDHANDVGGSYITPPSIFAGDIGTGSQTAFYPAADATMGTSAGQDSTGWMELFNMSSTTGGKSARFHSVNKWSSNSITATNGVAIQRRNEAMTGMRFKFSGGNVAAGTFKLYRRIN